ncbi:hypothetical protein BC826DRAFT_310001 [Russula brevipes]|nr:hypothetical protein BC826DRAFT_310001 [Russula brevipes]
MQLRNSLRLNSRLPDGPSDDHNDYIRFLIALATWQPYINVIHAPVIVGGTPSVSPEGFRLMCHRVCRFGALTLHIITCLVSGPTHMLLERSSVLQLGPFEPYALCDPPAALTMAPISKHTFLTGNTVITMLRSQSPRSRHLRWHPLPRIP